MDKRIDRLQRRAAADSSVISLAGGLPASSLFPSRALAASASRVLRREGEQALQYAWPEGREGLRRWVAERLARRGAQVSAADVIITSGAQQAIAVAAELTVPRGGRVAVDAESYPGALDLLRVRGAVLVEHASDAACRYLTPAVTNPRGRRMSPDARAAALEAARRGASFLIEDDAYADLCFDGDAGRPLLADAPGRVFHVGTFSKVLAPGLRIGWLIAPRAQREAALEQKRLQDLQSNSLTQAILDDFLGEDDFDARLARARRLYQRRATRLCAALRRHLPEWTFEAPVGGFSVWAEAPEEGDEPQLLETAARFQTGFDPGRMFVAHGGSRPIGMRLAFSLEPSSRIEEAVRRLAAAWKAFRLAPTERPRATSEEAGTAVM